MQAVIGLGGAGSNTIAYFQGTNTQVDLRYLHINNDERDLKNCKQSEGLLLPHRQQQPGCTIQAFDFGDSLGRTLVDCDSCYVICGMGGSCADALRDLLSACQLHVPEVFLIAYLPFSFEQSRIRAAIAQKEWVAQELPCLAGYLFIDLEEERKYYPSQSLTNIFNDLYSRAKAYIQRNRVRNERYKEFPKQDTATQSKLLNSDVEPNQRIMTSEEVAFFTHHYDNHFMTFKSVCLIKSIEGIGENTSFIETEGKSDHVTDYNLAGTLLIPHIGGPDMLFSADFWMSFKNRILAEEKKDFLELNLSLYWLVEGHFFIDLESQSFQLFNPSLQLIYPPYSIIETAYNLDQHENKS